MQRPQQTDDVGQLDDLGAGPKHHGNTLGRESELVGHHGTSGRPSLADCMLRVLFGTVEALMIALISYNLVVAVFGWRNPKAIPVGARQRRLRVVIPAHDEGRVVGGLLDDLVAQDYPGDQHEVWVVADRCNDRTADIALERGARVAERGEGLEGKGPALAWYLDENPLEPGEAIVVLDADNRVSSDLLSRLADVLDQGHQAIQTYLDVANPDASMLATASALSYWASNRVVQLARHNLGWPADLGGTGMCLTAEALDAAGGFGSAAAEDQELGVRLFLAGIRLRGHTTSRFTTKNRPTLELSSGSGHVGSVVAARSQGSISATFCRDPRPPL